MKILDKSNKDIIAILTEEKERFERDNYEEILTSISEDIILNNILDQIEDSLNIETIKEKQSLFNYFDIRMKALIDTYTYENEEYPTLIETIDEVLNIISKKIEEVFNIEIIYSDIIDIEKKINYVKALYNFFTVNLYKTVTNLSYSFINKNLEVYVKEIGKINTEERNNLSYKYLQTDIDNEYTPFIYNLDSIINTLDFPEGMYSEDVIEMITNEDQGEETYEVINNIFIDNEWVEVLYKESLANTLLEVIHKNYNLIREIKIKFINELKDKNEEEIEK